MSRSASACGCRRRRRARWWPTPGPAASCRAFLNANDLYVYTVNAFPVRALQGTAGEGAGLRAGLALARAHPVHDRTSPTILAEIAPASIDAVDPDRPARLQAERHRLRRRRRLHRRNVLHVVAHLVELEARTGRTVTLAIEPEPILLPRDDRRDGRLLHRAPLHRRGGRATLAELAGIAGLGRAPWRCAATSGSSSTPATRRSSTRTWPTSLENAASTPVSRSSSSRRRRRCGSPRSPTRRSRC